MIDFGILLSVVSIFMSGFVVVKYHLDSECFGRISYDAEDESDNKKYDKTFKKHKM